MYIGCWAHRTHAGSTDTRPASARLRQSAWRQHDAARVRSSDMRRELPFGIRESHVWGSAEHGTRAQRVIAMTWLACIFLIYLPGNLNLKI